MADKDDLKGWGEDDYADIEGMATFGWAPAHVMDQMPRLKLVSSFGVGYDGIAASHAAKKGVIVTHTPNVLNDDVANTAIALMLAVTRRIVAQDRYLRAGKWVSQGNAPLTRTIRGKTVGIVGLGRIGETIARKLSVFECTIVYHSRSEKDVDYEYFADLKEMATASDILVIITPGGPETDKLIDKPIIEALGPDGTLVNVARGTVVDEQETGEGAAGWPSGRSGFGCVRERAQRARSPVCPRQCGAHSPCRLGHGRDPSGHGRSGGGKPRHLLRRQDTADSGARMQRYGRSRRLSPPIDRPGGRHLPR